MDKNMFHNGIYCTFSMLLENPEFSYPLIHPILFLTQSNFLLSSGHNYYSNLMLPNYNTLLLMEKWILNCKMTPNHS